MLLDISNVITGATDNKEIVEILVSIHRLGMHKPNENGIPGWAKIKMNVGMD